MRRIPGYHPWVMSKRADDRVDAVIRSAGLKVTRQRRAIVRVLSTAGDHPDANEIHRRAQALDPSVSVATTYRTLAALSDKGVVNRLAFEGASARFETNDAPHHDHIVDLDSGEVIEFVSSEIERLQHKIAEAHGYEIVSHRLELYCRKQR
jgi:Fur family ferric uptake transcriptional regulator